jgi:diguanylate cyclase (GGDEF)-like protein
MPMARRFEENPQPPEATMEGVPDTWLTIPKRVVANTSSSPCIVQIYPTCPNMGFRFSLSEVSLIFGRDKDCDIQLEDHSVSRHHAKVQKGPEGYYVVDLESTNGTYINDEATQVAKLKDGDYLRIGNCIFRYLSGGNVEAEYHEEIYRLTIIDGLTGIHNQRYLLEFLDRELARSARHKRPLAFIMFDLDLFKRINDQLGHLGGDYTLRELAAVVTKAIRKEELFSRYGGEEFALVLPETTRTEALEVAERVRKLVQDHPFCYEGERYLVTISLGVVCITGEEALTPSELIRQADGNLYMAKSTGRNRVIG